MNADRAMALLFLVCLMFSGGFSLPYAKDIIDSDPSCEYSENPKICIQSLKALGLEPKSGTVESAKLAAYSSHISVEALLISTRKIIRNTNSELFYSSLSDLRKNATINDCVDLLLDARDLISKTQSALESSTELGNVLEDVHTWMSGALTYYTTCIYGFRSSDEAEELLVHSRFRVKERLSIFLACIAKLRESYLPRAGCSNLWAAQVIGNNTLVPNKTVAQDGSGDFTTIKAALAAAPNKSSSRYVIYIKSGTYVESFEVANKKNLVFMGDGIGKTIITGNKSVQDPNITTFNSATVVIKSDDFIAQDITFQNTAGAVNHQAVAVRISADKVAFFRCSFEGYQDTLYTHSLRQFFIECDIYGTVDYIFGNSAALFQNCNLYARLPLPKQKNTYTAQGRTDPNQNTGFSFQNCNIDGVDELKRNISQYPTYLGRPWKEYSLTVFLKCYESSVLHPAGWLVWDGDFALKTLFYAEYFSYGAGGDTSKRVNWSSVIYNSTFASQFSAARFISGNDWLMNTNLPFTLGL